MSSTKDGPAGELQAELERLRESQRQLKQHNAILLRLALAQQSEQGLEEKLQTFTKEVAQFLSTQRVAVRLFSSDRQRLRCHALYNRAAAEHTAEKDLLVGEYPTYIDSLQSARVIAAVDAMADLRTSEFAKSHLTPLGITSVLHVPIHVGGQLRGVLSCEHIGQQRSWDEADERFAVSVCDLVAASLATSDMRRAQGTMRALLESAAQGVIAVNEAGQITLVNSLIEKVFGYRREELLGTQFEKLIPEGLTGDTLEIQDGTLSRSSSEIGIGRYFTAQKKDGSIFPVEIALSFVKQDGEHLMLALLTDVTQRVAFERKLKQSEQLYRSVVEDLTDLISRCRPDGTRIFVNDAYCHYHGKSREELLGTAIWEHIPPRDRKKIRESFAKLTPHNPVNIYEHRVLRPDGKLALNEWLDRAIFDDAGVLHEIQSIGRDVTEQREAEARLREAQRLESIAVLASGIAHDFNNLLTPILIYSEGLSNYFADGSVESSQVLQILAAANRAKELVRQILTFGRKGQESRREPTAVAPIIHDTIQLVRASVPTHIDFKINIDTECGVVEADATELYQILSNLCTNACQAMPAGGTLTMSASEVMLQHTELPHGLYTQLIVQDTGAGISQENLDKIFDPFFTTKSLGEGTGLGLSVVHGTVTSLGGNIEVQSQIGKGTTFVVYLPCTDKQPVEGERSKLQQQLSSGDERILLVDDEQSVLESTQFMLQQLGYRVTSCSSANEALNHFSAHPEDYDMVLSDMTMPRTSGIELLRRIRELRAEVPVVLMTGFAGLLNEEELRRIGINEFLIKPINSQKLGSTIRHCLDPLATSKTKPPASPADCPKTSPAQVLIIDDDPLILRAMTKLLSSLGYSPFTANSLNEAFERLTSESIDAVLVDHHLGSEDGFESAGEIRNRAGGTPPLIIGMSGSGDLENADDYALDGCLVKPFSADQLRHLLERCGSTSSVR
ncbi:MAG: response regulator [Planctomycetales bacterium]|nr:response regulator [Planctomycetales bacterium]